MHFSAYSTLLFAAVSLASPALLPLPGYGCQNGKLASCFASCPRTASAYCSSYMQPVTVTVKTVKPKTTVKATVTTTNTVETTDTTTETERTTSTETERTTSTETVLSTTTVATETKTETFNVPQKRDTAPTPSCLTKNGYSTTSYPPAKIASACSCIGITRSTVSVTYTAPTITVSRTKTAGTETTSATTVTETETETHPTTVTIEEATTTTSEVDVTATTTTLETAYPCPTNINNGYSQYYKGSGYTETDQNPGNVVQDPYQTTFSADTPLCDAVNQCATLAFQQPGADLSFQLYRLKSTGAKVCRAYFNPSRNPALFNVQNDDVDVAFGYSY